MCRNTKIQMRTLKVIKLFDLVFLISWKIEDSYMPYTLYISIFIQVTIYMIFKKTKNFGSL